MIQYTNITTASMDYVAYYLYVGEGLLLMVLNTPVAFIIFATPNLRIQKEFIIFAFSMIFDAIFGFSYLYCGVFRLVLYYNEQYIPLWTSWMCFNTPMNYGFVFITPGAGLFCLAVAIDRLFSVFLPIKYIKLPSYYSYFVVSGIFIGTIPTFVISAIKCYDRREIYEFSMICNIQDLTIPFLFYSLRGIRILATILAALLYIPIGLRVYYIIHSTKKLQQFNNQSKKKLLKMTITIILITASQLALFTYPDLFVFTHPNDASPTIFFLMNLNKGVINIFIFFITQRELRKAVFSKISSKFIWILGSSSTQSNPITAVGNTKVNGWVAAQKKFPSSPVRNVV